MSSQIIVPEALNNTMTVFEVITSICIIIIGIPQLIKVIKEKNTNDVSFTSFWIYHYGIFFWVFFAAFAPGVNYLSTLISETITIFINGILMYFLYYYKKGLKKSHFWIANANILLTWILSVAFIIIYFEWKDLRFNGTVTFILSLIGPAGAVLPFTPQLIKSFKTKKWQGVSYWLFVLYTINNIAWIVFFSVGTKIQIITSPQTNDYWNWVGGLIWQIIGFILFGFQLGLTLDDKIKRKRGLRFDEPKAQLNTDKAKEIYLK